MIGERYESRTRLRVQRVSAGQVVLMQLRRAEPLGIVTHWIGRENFVCVGDGCPACFGAVGGRWVGEMPVRVWEGSSWSRTRLIELTGCCWSRLDGLLRMEGVESAVGVCVEGRRRTKRAELMLEPVKPPDSSVCSTLPDWVILDALATLFRLPRCTEGMSGDEWVSRVRDVARVRLERAAASVDLK